MDAITVVLIESVRIMFIVGLPLIGASIAGGLVASLLQTFLALKDTSALYAGRMCAVVVTLYLMTPIIFKSLQEVVALSMSRQ